MTTNQVLVTSDMERNGYHARYQLSDVGGVAKSNEPFLNDHFYATPIAPLTSYALQFREPTVRFTLNN